MRWIGALCYKGGVSIESMQQTGSTTNMQKKNTLQHAIPPHHHNISDSPGVTECQEDSASPASAEERCITGLELAGDGAEPPVARVDLPAPERQVFKVKRHPETNRELIDWFLEVEKRCLIVGDSNLSRIPEYSIPDLQIESYPGANFRHMQALFEIAHVPWDLVVQNVVIAAGINAKGQNIKETAVKQLQRALKMAKHRFPSAVIWVPLVNFSGNLSAMEQNNMKLLNQHIKKKYETHPPAGGLAFCNRKRCNSLDRGHGQSNVGTLEVFFKVEYPLSPFRVECVRGQPFMAPQYHGFD